jgi:hypothetical protein
MTENRKSKAPRKKTPVDATLFEREQLRFFLSGGDVAATLSEFNPSLAWLPVLSEMKLIESENQLIAWIERNFADVDAVRDVVANIHFFGPETASFLEFRLNNQAVANHSARLFPASKYVNPLRFPPAFEHLHRAASQAELAYFL